RSPRRRSGRVLPGREGKPLRRRRRNHSRREREPAPRVRQGHDAIASLGLNYWSGTLTTKEPSMANHTADELRRRMDAVGQHLTDRLHGMEPGFDPVKILRSFAARD